MGSELVATTAVSGDAILAIIEKAATSDSFDVAKMKELMDLKRDWDRDRAAEIFGAAISRFQRVCPPVHKSRDVNAGPMRYTFASYDDVMKVATPHLNDSGIALSFSTEANEKGIRVTCRVRVGIHAEDYTLDVPVPDMKVNNTQRYGAALSYAKRYALCAALNIVVTDEDVDANYEVEIITEEQAVTIQEWLDSKDVKPADFLKWAGCDSIATLPVNKFQTAVDMLRKRPVGAKA